MTSQYQDFVKDLPMYRNQITRGINEMERLHGEERSKKIRDIEENLSNLNQLIQTIKNEMPMMEQTERSRMTKILQDYQPEAQRLEDRFRDAKNRGELLGTHKEILEGGSKSERQQLLNQSDMIRKGNDNLSSFVTMGHDVEDIGQGALSALGDQKEKQFEISNKLEDISLQAKTGERTADRMLCRQKRRTAILWIVIVLVVIIFLAVFLYFVFRP